MIKLTNRYFFVKKPGFPSVLCNANTAIITINNMTSVFRVDPKCVMIRMDTVIRYHHFEIFSAIFTGGNHLVNKP